MKRGFHVFLTVLANMKCSTFKQSSVFALKRPYERFRELCQKWLQHQGKPRRCSSTKCIHALHPKPMTAALKRNISLKVLGLTRHVASRGRFGCQDALASSSLHSFQSTLFMNLNFELWFQKGTLILQNHPLKGFSCNHLLIF